MRACIVYNMIRYNITCVGMSTLGIPKHVTYLYLFCILYLAYYRHVNLYNNYS